MVRWFMWVIAIAAEPDGRSVIPRTPMREIGNRLLQAAR